MICLEPLGTDVFLPAIVLGHEVPDAVTAEQLDAALPAEGPIVCVHQQAGGYCMSYPTVVGALLRLAANRGRDGQPLDLLVRGLKAMAEDPDMQVLRQHPALLALVYTHGRPYDPRELASLTRHLGRFLDVPAIASGIEAFVRFAPCDLLAVFRGWKVLSCRLPAPDPARAPLYRNLPGQHFDDSNARDLIRDDKRTLGGDLLRELADVGQRLGLRDPPTAFLLWENSD